MRLRSALQGRLNSSRLYKTAPPVDFPATVHIVFQTRFLTGVGATRLFLWHKLHGFWPQALR